MITNILIPVDGSDPAQRAATVGLELAARYDASVDVLHVLERRTRSDQTQDGTQKERGQEILESVTELDVGAVPEIETHLVRGRPSKAIRAHVREHDIDLVTMGRRGRSGLTEHLLGSVTERVLRKTRTPVVMVPAAEPTAGPRWSCDDILLTTDGSDVAERGAPYASDLARRLEATLHLMMVVDVQGQAGLFDAGGVSSEYVDRLKSEAQAALDRLAEQIDPAVDHQSSLCRGTPHTEISAYATENTVDLIVMASEGESNLVGQHLGGVTKQVLQTTKRPVLVIPTPD